MTDADASGLLKYSARYMIFKSEIIASPIDGNGESYDLDRFGRLDVAGPRTVLDR